jgi:hypothetical protein
MGAVTPRRSTLGIMRVGCQRYRRYVSDAHWVRFLFSWRECLEAATGIVTRVQGSATGESSGANKLRERAGRDRAPLFARVDLPIGFA